MSTITTMVEEWRRIEEIFKYWKSKGTERWITEDIIKKQKECFNELSIKIVRALIEKGLI